jgi:hypothetical protein
MNAVVMQALELITHSTFLYKLGFGFLFRRSRRRRSSRTCNMRACSRK